MIEHPKTRYNLIFEKKYNTILATKAPDIIKHSIIYRIHLIGNNYLYLRMNVVQLSDVQFYFNSKVLRSACQKELLFDF